MAQIRNKITSLSPCVGAYMYCDADFIYGLSKRCQWRRVHNRDAALCSVVGGVGGDAAARPHGSGSLRAPGLVRRLHRRCAARDASSGSPSNHHGGPSSTTTVVRPLPPRRPVLHYGSPSNQRPGRGGAPQPATVDPPPSGGTRPHRRGGGLSTWFQTLVIAAISK